MAIHLKRHTYDPGEPLTLGCTPSRANKLIDFLRRNRASLADVPIDEAGEVMADDDNASAEKYL